MSAVLERDVQTSTPDAATTLVADGTMAFTGKLAHRAHAAVAPLTRGGQMCHVVVVDLCEVGPARQHLHANVACASAEAAVALAESLKRGDELTVAGPLSHMRIHLDAAFLLPSTETSQCSLDLSR